MLRKVWSKSGKSLNKKIINEIKVNLKYLASNSANQYFSCIVCPWMTKIKNYIIMAKKDITWYPIFKEEQINAYKSSKCLVCNPKRKWQRSNAIVEVNEAMSTHKKDEEKKLKKREPIKNLKKKKKSQVKKQQEKIS